MSIELAQQVLGKPWIKRSAFPAAVLSATLVLAGCGEASSTENDPMAPVATAKPAPSATNSSASPTKLPTSSTPTPTETASEPASLSAEQIEALAPTPEDHAQLPPLTRVYYNWQYYLDQYEGDYSTYLLWELYKEKDANGNLIPDEQTSIYNYNPADPESTPSPDDTCEQIRQEFIFYQGMLGAITDAPAKFYDENNERPLLTDKVNRLLAGMFVQPYDGSHAAKYYDAMVFNYTKAREVARPDPDLARLECQSTKTKGNKVTTLDVGGQKVKAVKKDVVLKLKDAGTVYDATFALVSGTVGDQAVSSWLVYSFDERN